MADHEFNIAVVGFGPRGLGALEALFETVGSTDIWINIDIFDPIETLGSGPNFDKEQSDLCILNIPVRVLDFPPPAKTSNHISSFEDWSDRQYAPDDFPARSEIGGYLNARFKALRAAADRRFTIRHIKSLVVNIGAVEDGWVLESGGSRYGRYQEVLMTQGQPQTRADDQLAKWIKHAEDTTCTLMPTYPANDLIATARDWTGKTVAIRGLGLSTFDALRLLTAAQGGRFVNGRYKASGREPALIFPFSLNGRPPAPKPATAVLDATFDPTQQETEAFKSALENALSKAPEAAMATIISALVQPANRILHTGNEADILTWVTEECEEAGQQESQDAIASLKAHIAMAKGEIIPSIGYVIGQLWRKWQNDLRHGFNTVTLEPETAARIITFDEGLKRFSYGPPVTASLELLALIKAGIVSLRAVDDPDVALLPEGWRLSDHGENEIVTVMVDAVLPGPDLEAVTDALISSCKSKGLISIEVESMGVRCHPDGQVVDQQGEVRKGLCMLGRLTMGSVIAADSLHDCFGKSADRWANGVIARTHTSHRF